MLSGIQSNLSNDAYHADTDSISRSALMEFKRSPFHYWSLYLNPERPQREQTAALTFGNAFHTFILEPQLFNERYVVEPERVLLKDVGRDRYDEYKATIAALSATNKIILSRDD